MIAFFLKNKTFCRWADCWTLDISQGRSLVVNELDRKVPASVLKSSNLYKDSVYIKILGISSFSSRFKHSLLGFCHRSYCNIIIWCMPIVFSGSCPVISVLLWELKWTISPVNKFWIHDRLIKENRSVVPSSLPLK